MSFGERFLEEPDFFPARPSGDPWGERRMALAFAGAAFDVQGLAPDQEEAIRRRYLPLVTNPADNDGFEVQIFRAAKGDFRSFDLRGWTMTVDLEASEGAVRVAGLGFMGRVDWRPGLAASLWTPPGGGFLSAFDNFLRVITSYVLLERGGALLHSAGVLGRGGAWLFCGPSGAGKSTLARRALAAGRTVLSDDLNGLWRQAGEPRVGRVPFTGELGAELEEGATAVGGGAHPLRGVLRLEKAERPAFRPASRAEAVGYAVASAPFANADPNRAGRLAGNLENLLDGVPRGVLAFPREADFEELLDLVEEGA